MHVLLILNSLKTSNPVTTLKQVKIFLICITVHTQKIYEYIWKAILSQELDLNTYCSCIRRPPEELVILSSGIFLDP